jgi:hypothetical protein
MIDAKNLPRYPERVEGSKKQHSQGGNMSKLLKIISVGAITFTLVVLTNVGFAIACEKDEDCGAGESCRVVRLDGSGEKRCVAGGRPMPGPSNAVKAIVVPGGKNHKVPTN